MTSKKRERKKVYKHTEEIVWQVREASDIEIGKSEDIYNEFAQLKSECREHFYVVTLNQKNKMIDKYLVSVGSLTASLVHPREVFKPAIMDSAAAIILVHNHPSGESAPSVADKQLTHRLKECCELFGIRLLDHVIIGKDQYTSFDDDHLI